MLKNLNINHEFRRKCLRYSIVNTVNNASQTILDKVSTHSLKGFSLYIKNQLIDKYNITCKIRNCYICAINLNNFQ